VRLGVVEGEKLPVHAAPVAHFDCGLEIAD
jgi:hypothetical protein